MPDASVRREAEPSGDELSHVVGAIVIATTRLELSLGEAVTSLSNSALTSLLVRGERGSTLIRMCKRLLIDGVGSTTEDEQSGRTARLALMSHEETARFIDLLNAADNLLGLRDHVVHSMWLPADDGSGYQGRRLTRSRADSRDWTLEKLWRLRQDIVNASVDIFIASWNATSRASGIDRIDDRPGDVVG